MSVNFLQLLYLFQEYGYLIIFTGTFFEGETTLVLGGLLAFQGHLKFWIVVAIAVFASYLGHLVFYFLGGLAAAMTQIAANPASAVPTLGASGAIAAVMGSFLISFPHDRIRTILFLGFFVTIYSVPAILLVGFWFLIQLFSEVGSLVHRRLGGIAYMAHIGGFVFGMASAFLSKIPRGMLTNK